MQEKYGERIRLVNRIERETGGKRNKTRGQRKTNERRRGA